MGFLIDSTALLDAFADPRHTMDAGLLSGEAAEQEEFYLSVITADELLRSVAYPSGRARARRLAFVEAVLDRFPILSIDRATVRMHAEIQSSLERRKLRMDLHESWIAATCLAHGLSLASSQPEDYQRVEGLKVRKV